MTTQVSAVEILSLSLEDINAGQWRCNTTGDPHGKGCALGLVMKNAGYDATPWANTPEEERSYDLLYERPYPGQDDATLLEIGLTQEQINAARKAVEFLIDAIPDHKRVAREHYVSDADANDDIVYSYNDKMKGPQGPIVEQASEWFERALSIASSKEPVTV